MLQENLVIHAHCQRTQAVNIKAHKREGYGSLEKKISTAWEAETNTFWVMQKKTTEGGSNPPPPRRNSVKYDNTTRFFHVKGCKVNVESMKSWCDLVYWEVELEEYPRILWVFLESISWFKCIHGVPESMTIICYY